MTIREYISQKLSAWEVNEVLLADISSDICIDNEYTEDDKEQVGKAMIGIIEEVMLAPYMKSVSENGFSVSYDYSKIGQYYMWLCRKYGISPNTDVVAALGLSTITDKTDIW